METTTTEVTTSASEEVIETTSTEIAMSEFEQEVLGHMRFQTSAIQIGLAVLVAVFIWKFLKQFF